MSEKSIRYCLIEETGFAAMITLTAATEFIAGADFKLIQAETKEVLENWKMTAENGKSSVYKIKTEVHDLNKIKLVWQILVCSTNSNVYEGKVHIQVLQNRVPLKLTVPASYSVSNVPPCQLNSAETITGSLFFVIKSSVPELSI